MPAPSIISGRRIACSTGAAGLRKAMRGYFGIGAEGISKPMNLCTLFRTAHAFGASFLFTVNAQYARREGGRAATSDAPGPLPLYSFTHVQSVRPPVGCILVCADLTHAALQLPHRPPT